MSGRACDERFTFRRFPAEKTPIIFSPERPRGPVRSGSGKELQRLKLMRLLGGGAIIGALLLPARLPRHQVTATADHGDSLPESLRMFSATSLRTISAGQAVLWKPLGSSSFPVSPWPATLGSLLLCLDQAG